jgi:DNA-3-methyladenine glycosylase
MRSGKTYFDKDFGNGPGKVSRIMGIHFRHSGTNLTRKPAGPSGKGIWLEDGGRTVTPEEIIAGPRIGVEYAGRDALLPYRFRIIQ